MNGSLRTSSLLALVLGVFAVWPLGCCGGGSSDDEVSAVEPDPAADPGLEDPPGAPIDPEDEPAEPGANQPASAVPFGPENAVGFQTSAEGFCTKAIKCGCQSVKGLTPDVCAEKFTKEVLHGKPMAAPLWSCLLQMSCDDLCADRTAAAEPCMKAAVAASGGSRSGRSGHDTAMGIIENMGSTCPPGTNKVNGSCVNY